jgi:AbrB family looped-hinge helix DNA binding protein
MSLVKVKNKFQLTIPAEIRDKVKLEVGDILEVTVQNKNIVLKPKVVVDRNSLEAAIAEGLEDYEEGRVFGPFKSVKEFKEALKKS